MKKKKILSILLIFTSSLLVLVLFLCFFYRNHRSVSYEPEVFAETADKLSNPGRGFYRIYQYLLTDGENTPVDAIAAHISQDKDYSLCLLEINLKEYASRPLSDKALSQTNTILSGWAHAHKQIILRFLYDWDGKALESEPQTLEQIIAHMDQLAPAINQYADNIYILQGAFIGNYAEMHSTSFGNMQDITTLVTHLAQITDPSIYLSVRTPAQWRSVTGCEAMPASFPAYDGSLISRLGLFNDGILGSYTDVGTYRDESQPDSSSLENEASREEELDFQNTLCEFVPNGGEVIINSSLNDFADAVPVLSQMHISYLNDMYDPGVLKKWKNTLYESSDCFNGYTGYDYICAHLGYRYLLTDSAFTFETPDDPRASLSFTLKNTGFASALRPFKAFITLQDKATGETEDFPAALELRTLKSGGTVTASVSIPLNNLRGEYAFYLNIQDSVSGQTVFLGSTPKQTEYGYPVGKLSVSEGLEVLFS